MRWTVTVTSVSAKKDAMVADAEQSAWFVDSADFRRNVWPKADLLQRDFSSPLSLTNLIHGETRFGGHLLERNALTTLAEILT